MKKFNKNLQSLENSYSCQALEGEPKSSISSGGITSAPKSRKVAFTLAEALIAMAIIGVVAALTIPPLVRNYNEYVTVNKVKKFYSTMSKAYQRSIVDNGRADEWKVEDGASTNNSTKLASYLKPYLKISKDCGTKSGCLGYKNKIKRLRGDEHTNYDTNTKYYKFVLLDRSVFWFRTSNGEYCKSTDGGYPHTCGEFWFDINGNKGPNTFGKDIFTFILMPNGFYPDISNDCQKSSGGWGCSSYIIQNGNMNYLH